MQEGGRTVIVVQLDGETSPRIRSALLVSEWQGGHGITGENVAAPYKNYAIIADTEVHVKNSSSDSPLARLKRGDYWRHSMQVFKCLNRSSNIIFELQTKIQSCNGQPTQPRRGGADVVKKFLSHRSGESPPSRSRSCKNSLALSSCFSVSF